MKRYCNAALVYAILAMAGGVFYRNYQIQWLYRQNHIVNGTYALFSAGNGVVSDAAFVGAEFFFYRRKNKACAGSLPCGTEPDKCDAGCEGDCSDVGNLFVKWSKRGHFRVCGDWPHFVGCEYRSAASPDSISGVRRQKGGKVNRRRLRRKNAETPPVA